MDETSPSNGTAATGRQELMAAITYLAACQAGELWAALTREQERWGEPLLPNALQLIYEDEVIHFAWGGDVSLPVRVNGTERTLLGSELIGALASDARLLLPSNSPFAHFTFIRGGNVSLEGITIARPMRFALAWDVRRLLWYVASSTEPLPYPHKLANTFQELHVYWLIERLGVRRGPMGRQDRLRGALRRAKKPTGEDYLHEVSSTSATTTADDKFWRGVSPAVPPWRFLSVQGQRAEFTRHRGRDTLPGHLAERVMAQILDYYEMVIHRRGGDERILTETELVDAQVCEAESRGDQSSERIAGLDGFPGLKDDPESVAIRNELISEVRKIPGYDVWYMSEILDMRQDEIGETLGRSQGRVSQLLKQFKEQARTLVDDN